MANIEAERAWYRRMQERGPTTAERRWAPPPPPEPEPEPGGPLAPPTTCDDCGHGWHSWWNGYWIAYWCAEPTCFCGVASCVYCQLVHRDWTFGEEIRDGTFGPQPWPTQTCGACGLTSYVPVYG